MKHFTNVFTASQAIMRMVINILGFLKMQEMSWLADRAELIKKDFSTQVSRMKLKDSRWNFYQPAKELIPLKMKNKFIS
jgi:hypothetical protein